MPGARTIGGMTIRVMDYHGKYSIHNHCDQCDQSVLLQRVITQSAILISAFLLNAILLSVILLNAILLSVALLYVTVPKYYNLVS
jgi:hypothetical protein